MVADGQAHGRMREAGCSCDEPRVRRGGAAGLACVVGARRASRAAGPGRGGPRARRDYPKCAPILTSDNFGNSCTCGDLGDMRLMDAKCPWKGRKSTHFRQALTSLTSDKSDEPALRVHASLSVDALPVRRHCAAGQTKPVGNGGDIFSGAEPFQWDGVRLSRHDGAYQRHGRE